jgi:hypothetical protein
MTKTATRKVPGGEQDVQVGCGEVEDCDDAHQGDERCDESMLDVGALRPAAHQEDATATVVSSRRMRNA